VSGDTEKFQVRVLNQVSSTGLKRLPWERFTASVDVDRPDAILLRSADLHGSPIPESVLAVGRAGAGVNNIPVAELTRRGVPVFNAPGANANAVKELWPACCSRLGISTVHSVSSAGSIPPTQSWTPGSRPARRSSVASSWPARRSA
jgi:hypothetical protein